MFYGIVRFGFFWRGQDETVEGVIPAGRLALGLFGEGRFCFVFLVVIVVVVGILYYALSSRHGKVEFVDRLKSLC